MSHDNASGKAPLPLPTDSQGFTLPVPSARSLCFAFWVCLLVLIPFVAKSADRVVLVYNWTDYMDPYALQRLTAETGIKVVYDVCDGLETLEAELLARRSGYEVVVPTSKPHSSGWHAPMP